VKIQELGRNTVELELPRKHHVVEIRFIEYKRYDDLISFINKQRDNLRIVDVIVVRREGRKCEISLY
jgi:hypothetical protein